MKDAFAPMGAAPRIVPVLVPGLVAAGAASAFLPRLASFQGILRGLGFAAGLWWAALGLAFYADVVVRLLRALAGRRLAAGGTYAACRHPLFAWWIFFVLPSAALLLDNWLFLACMPLLFLAAARAAKEEEAALEAELGDEYRRYRERVRFLVPIPRRVRPPLAAFGRLVLFALAVGLYSAAAYALLVAPVMNRFGATGREAAAALPGDGWAGPGASGYTQALTIEAPPEETWKWLVQVGYRRAGWYNVDAINALAAPDYFYDGKGSSVRIVPELQDPAVGDEILLVPGLGFRIASAVPGRELLLLGGDPGQVAAVNSGGAMPEGYRAVSWAFVLSEADQGRTRLVVRFRSRGASLGLLGDLAWDLVGTVGGAVLQQPAMLRGLAARAEGRVGAGGRLR